jgi:DNA modification methylase
MITKPNCLPIVKAKRTWRDNVTHSENSFHQLSPYIGKLKSSIAKDLIQNYSTIGSVVADPFCGSGTIPLEAARLGRRVIASDLSPYAAVLTKAKIFAPASLEQALTLLSEIDAEVALVREFDLRKIPAWVRLFFNPKTLKEILRFSEILRRPGNEFFFAALLGILHHQRPGFLSYPSSHLVPYLRNNLFPRNTFPELYDYRPVLPRLRAKLIRAYKRNVASSAQLNHIVTRSPVSRIVSGNTFDCLITSPPYMNALDYGRDNRLRLWLTDPNLDTETLDAEGRKTSDFKILLNDLASLTNAQLRNNGSAIIIIGDLKFRDVSTLAEFMDDNFANLAPSLKLEKIVADKIPDIRRSRRAHRGIKHEYAFIYRNVK